MVNHDRLALLVHRGAVYRSTGVDRTLKGKRAIDTKLGAYVVL